MNKQRVYNFGAGPAALPTALLEEVQAELLNWRGLGASVMELGHRGPEFVDLLAQAKSDLRDLLLIPQHYHILFLGGAARSHFALVPMNFLGQGRAAYLLTGLWSKMALAEAQNIAQAYCFASSEAEAFKGLPNIEHAKVLPDTTYFYFTPNETVNGVATSLPVHADLDRLPIVADMTSCLLTEPININDYGLIFAGAQKNIAPAGLTIVIIRDDLLQLSPIKPLASIFDYRTHVAHDSLYATSPTFNCYMAAKMFVWLKQKGGLQAMQLEHVKKSTMLYDYIDNASMYHVKVERQARSRLNVCFDLLRPELTDLFVHLANQEGLIGLRGHRSVGGLRASLYNAVSVDAVKALIHFMQTFEQKYL